MKILADIIEIYFDIMLIGLIIQFIRWTLQDDDNKRELKSYVAGAVVWPYLLYKECRKLISKVE